jgi:hypothetical protein
MSTDSGGVDSATIEKTKQQIRGLVQEIAQLSRSEMGPEQYYAEVLHRIVTALAANGGAVWTIDSERRLRLDYQINISQLLVDPETEEFQRHFRLLQDVISKNEARLVAPLSGSGDPNSPGNPTNSLIVVAPMNSDDSIEGILEIFQRADSQPASQQGYLRFLVQMSQHIGDWLKARKLKTFSDRQSFWAKINGFSKQVHDSLDVRETSFTIANEGRRLIECDRVTVTVTKRGKQVVHAISGQDVVDMRSNVVSLISALASRVCATGESLWYNGKMDDFPPQVERALEAYVDESHTKSLAIIPLRKADPLKAKRSDELGADEHTKYQAGVGEVIGSLVVEQIDSIQSRDMIAPRVDEVCQQSARALGNALEHNDLFLMPLWRTIGKSRVLTTSKNMPKTLLISGLILLGTLAMFVLRKDFELKANGTLEPVVQNKVFAREDGEIIEVPVEHGQWVNKGDVLVVQENKELAKQLVEASTQYEKSLDQIRTALLASQIDRPDRQPQDQSVPELELERDHWQNQHQILMDRQRKLTVTSPTSGQVVSWDVEKNLLRRPVMRGQEIMRIADPKGPWELEVHLPEKRVGHLIRAMNERQAENPDQPLRVSFVLKSNPNSQFEGTLTKVAQTAEYDEIHGQNFLLKVAIDKDELVKELQKEIKQGTEVIAKVECGRASLAYALFHEAWEWLQTMIFSI